MQAIGQGMNKQRGGTLLGLILGALIGLGAALAVAVYITKVPVPFMSKIQPHNPDSDAAEAQKNKNWNPNAPLAGKNPAKPASASASGEVSLPTVPDPVAGSSPLIVPDPVITPHRTAAPHESVNPVPPALKPARAAISSDPLGDLAMARAGSAGLDPFAYFVQVGAFRTPADAEQQRARLLLIGVQAQVTVREQAGRTVHRVRVGPFERKEQADQMKARLDNNSIETALVRVQR